MLQKIVNGIAITSGIVSLTVVGTVGYVYVRKDAIIENVKGKIMESIMPGGMSGILGEGAGTGALNGIGGSLKTPSPAPDAPSAPTSPSLPVPSSPF